MTIKQNPDKAYAQEVRKKIKDNEGYCPCCLEKTFETKCMCKEFREQIEHGVAGECHCGLYVAEKDD